MVYGKLVSNEERLDEVNEILHEVFVDELKYKNERVFEITNDKVFHVLLYEGLKEDKAIATGRLISENEKAEIKWVAVKKNYRKKQYGDMVVRMLLDKARSMSISNIIAEVPIHLIGMFEKIGFTSMENEYYVDNENNRNIKMKFINLIKNCSQKNNQK